MTKPGPQQGPNRRSPNGFSLIELTIVLVITGIVLTIAMPRFDLTRFRLNTAYQVVSMTMMSAQRVAIRRQHAVVVSFDTVRKRLRVHEDRDNDGLFDNGEPVNYTMLEEGVVFGRGTTPARPLSGAAVSFVKTQAGIPAVTFHRSGSAGEIGIFYLTSGRQQGAGKWTGDTRAFEVERATGRTTVFTYVNNAWKRSF